MRVIYWQLTGDKKSAANWLRHKFIRQWPLSLRLDL
ncbi:hypothetical protein V5H41_11035 [Salmonella enterica]